MCDHCDGDDVYRNDDRTIYDVCIVEGIVYDIENSSDHQVHNGVCDACDDFNCCDVDHDFADVMHVNNSSGLYNMSIN